MEVRPSVEIVEAAYDDVCGLQYAKHGWPGHTLFDHPAAVVQSDGLYHTPHDRGLLPAEPSVEPRHADEAMAIGFRCVITIDPNDLPDAEVGKLLDDVARSV